jgi:hypothetical protein
MLGDESHFVARSRIAFYAGYGTGKNPGMPRKKRLCPAWFEDDFGQRIDGI